MHRTRICGHPKIFHCKDKSSSNLPAHVRTSRRVQRYTLWFAHAQEQTTKLRVLRHARIENAQYHGNWTFLALEYLGFDILSTLVVPRKNAVKDVTAEENCTITLVSGV